MVRKHDDEQLLNGELARLLTEAGVSAAAEQRVGRKKLDVIADVDGVRVVLEAEAGYQQQAQAIREADARLTQGLTAVAFAVCYPGDARTESLAVSQIMWTLRTEPDQLLSSWSTGAIPDLAEAVLLAPAAIENVDQAATLLSQGLDTAVTRLTLDQRETLAKAVNLPARKKNKRSDGFATAAKRGLLVVATAMLFHQRVHEHLEPNPPAAWNGDWPPKAATACALSPSTCIQDFDLAWETILAVDYAPVFTSARHALAALPTTGEAGQMIQTLARVVQTVARLVSGMRHDLLGRIFHRVLDTAKYDGSYYTSSAAATLLSGLAISPEERDWTDADSISTMRVCDPACGTGTLLMAAGQRIHQLRQRSLHHQGKQPRPEEDILLAESLVEDVLWGYDINITATHLAASALGMLSPKTQFRNMNLHICRFGSDPSSTYLGSLEALSGQLKLDSPLHSIRQIDDPEKQSLTVQPRNMSHIIMNPPYTRDSLRHRQFGTTEKAQMQAREASLVEDSGIGKYINRSGTSMIFTVLADKVLSVERGTLALVLPATIPTSPSGLPIRKFLGSRYYVETIVTSHDPKRFYFSENTKICEVLVVARRWNNSEDKPPTRIVKLTENPEDSFSAMRLVNQLFEGSPGSYIEHYVDADRIAQGDWHAVSVLSPWLHDQYRALQQNEFSSTTGTPSVPLGSLSRLGPDGRAVRDAFSESQLPSHYPYEAVYSQDSSLHNAMQTQPDSYLIPKEGKTRKCEDLWSKRSQFFVACRTRLNTSSVIGVAVDHPVLGSQWTPFVPIDGELATGKAIVTWLNSSLGLLSVLGGRTLKVLARPDLSMSAQGNIPVPSFADDTDARDALAAFFDVSKEHQLLPYSQLSTDANRQRIDDAVTEALGLSPEWVSSVRRELAKEPSVSASRYVGPRD